jgi:hypothetical protein
VVARLVVARLVVARLVVARLVVARLMIARLMIALPYHFRLSTTTKRACSCCNFAAKAHNPKPPR